MEKLIRRIGLVAHDAMKKDLIEWVLWNSELLMGHKFYCTGTTGTLIQEALKEKHPDVEWDFTILKSASGRRPADGIAYCGWRDRLSFLLYRPDDSSAARYGCEGTDASGKCGKHRLLLQPFHCRSYYFKSALP